MTNAQERRVRPRSVAIWLLSAALTVTIGGGGLAKLAGESAMVQLFDDLGAGQWLRYLTGLLEVAGGLGLLIPRIRRAAAIGLTTLLVCATVVNVWILHVNPALPIMLAVLTAGLAVARISASSGSPRS